MLIRRDARLASDRAKQDILKFGYSTEPIPVDSDIAISLSALAAQAWQLPRDANYAAGTRYRTLNRYQVHVSPENTQVVEIEDAVPYLQSERYNTVLGGIPRYYSPLPSMIAQGRGLMRLLTLLADRLPLATPGSDFDVNLHTMRFEAGTDRPCDTSPPGFHKDGEKYIAVVLLGYCGAAGGEVRIQDNARNELASFTMRQMGECYVIDDEIVWHMLTPVRTADGSSFAFRDIVLFDFLPRGWTATY